LLAGVVLLFIELAVVELEVLEQGQALLLQVVLLTQLLWVAVVLVLLTELILLLLVA
jgi:hypothetical protein